jgi:hypothetical protein
MHYSTLIVLMFLAFGQILMMTFGVLILWLAGEFGDPPKLFKDRQLCNDHNAANQAQETTAAMRQETGERSNEESDRLMALAHDHSIAPRAAEDPMHELEEDVGRGEACLAPTPAPDRAASAEK